MELNQFIKNFAETIEVDAATLTAETAYRSLDEWSSMNALAIIAMIDDEFDVAISGKAMRETHTIQELFDLVQSELD